MKASIAQAQERIPSLKTRLSRVHLSKVLPSKARLNRTFLSKALPNKPLNSENWP